MRKAKTECLELLRILYSAVNIVYDEDYDDEDFVQWYTLCSISLKFYICVLNSLLPPDVPQPGGPAVPVHAVRLLHGGVAHHVRQGAGRLPRARPAARVSTRVYYVVCSVQYSGMYRNLTSLLVAHCYCK